MSQEQGHDLPEPPSSPPFLPQYPRSFRKKRSRSIYSETPHTSSDPPVFSSDDPPEAEGLENYATYRKKRKYRGTWWSHEPVPETRSVKAKGELSRNIDSGVWLASDDTEDYLPDATTLLNHGVQHEDPYSVTEEYADEEAANAMGSNAPSFISQGDMIARQVIERRLELGDERIDLSDLSLSSISDATLKYLHSLIRNPRVNNEAPSPGRYESLAPFLQLFLSRNALRTLPPELWNLQHLSVLSLRNNKLTELPPCIAKLHNLVELNLAGNRLRWLPWELLRLVGPKGNLRRLNVRPNPLFEGVQFQGVLLGKPIAIKGIALAVDYLKQKLNLTRQGSSNFQQILSGDDLAEELEKLEEQCAWTEKLCNLFRSRGEKYSKEVIYSPSYVPRESHSPRDRLDTFITTYYGQPAFIASTPVTFFRFDGTLAPDSQIPPTALPLDVRHLPASLSGQAASPPGTSSMYAPSLLDLAIRVSTQHLSHAQILSLLPPDAPSHILQVLDAAENIRKTNGSAQRDCSICGRPFIIARTEWIEYWHYTPDSLFCAADDLFWPFLRRGCSWRCAFDPAVDELNGHHELADE